jgi:succinate dehydrogenase/fumarate reductase flavoprotein subunit
VAVEGDGGPAIMQALGGRANEAAAVECNAQATNLVQGAGGRVVGARFRQFDRAGFVRARRGVVLAAGGFAMNASMLDESAPWLGAPIVPVGAPYDDGSGIALGVSAGAAVAHMDGGFVSATNYPPASLLSGILVNAAGSRFVAEDSYHGRTAALAIAQPEGIAYLIVDSETFGHPEFGSLPLIDGWETMEEMEQALHLAPGSLVGTLSEYNRHAAAGSDPLFRKQPEWLKPLDTPPYAAFDASLGKATYVGFTLGGLRTSVDGEVLTGSGRRIGGLYACGACASSIVQDGLGYCSGICLGEATFFGRRAGRRAGLG